MSFLGKLGKVVSAEKITAQLPTDKIEKLNDQVNIADQQLNQVQQTIENTANDIKGKISDLEKQAQDAAGKAKAAIEEKIGELKAQAEQLANGGISEIQKNIPPQLAGVTSQVDQVKSEAENSLGDVTKEADGATEHIESVKELQPPNGLPEVDPSKITEGVQNLSTDVQP